MNDPGERADLEALRDLHGTLEAKGSGRRLEIAGAVCGTVDGLRDVLEVNRALGLGVWRPVTGAILDEVESFFQEAGTRYYVSVSPSARGLKELLEERGYEPGYAWAIFRRGAEPYRASTPLRVAEIASAREAEFAFVLARAYDVPAEVTEAIAAAVTRTGWSCFVSYDEEEPAGAAAMFVHDRAAWFGFAGTVPEHRRKGSQGALFSARIQKAAELGVEVLATETGQLVPDRPSNSYRNITRVGFEQRYVRPNYSLP